MAVLQKTTSKSQSSVKKHDVKEKMCLLANSYPNKVIKKLTIRELLK